MVLKHLNSSNLEQLALKGLTMPHAHSVKAQRDYMAAVDDSPVDSPPVICKSGVVEVGGGWLASGW